MKQAIFTFFAVLLAISSFAQVPQAFNYQAVIRDDIGNVIPERAISVRISILQEGLEGPVAYRETHQVETNQFGLINLQIGTGVPDINTFSTINWGTYQHFLQVEIDELGGSNYKNIGTSQLLSVPYALYAETAGNTFWQAGTGGIFYDEENVGINTDTITNFLTIEGDEPEGDARTFIRLQNNSTEEGSLAEMRFYAGENQSFTSLLHHSENYTFTPGEYADFGQLWSTGAGLNLRAAKVLTFQTGPTLLPGGGTAERMRISEDGNVGISTNEPKTKLHIQDGDIYLQTVGRGIIMKDENGDCWRVTINSMGGFESTQLSSCPESE